jgi:hypothetical protein
MWPDDDDNTLGDDMKGEFEASKKMQRYKDQFLKTANNIYKLASNRTIDFQFL